jgi:hypothetical protein
MWTRAFPSTLCPYPKGKGLDFDASWDSADFVICPPALHPHFPLAHFSPFPPRSQTMSLPAEVCSIVDQFLELYPGVPASPEVLGELLAEIKLEMTVKLRDGPQPKYGYAPTVWFQYEPKKKNSRLLVFVRPTKFGPEDTSTRDLFERRYDATTDGLLAAISDTKEVLERLRRGLCETCLAREPPRKKLKGKGLPSCTFCVFAGALGCRPRQ